MHESADKNSLTDNKPSVLPTAITLVVISAGIAFFELAKQLFFPGITLWASHIITIVFVSILASLVSYLIARKIRTLAGIADSEKAERERHYMESLKSQSLLDAALESIADGILVIDINGKIAKVNKRFIDLWNIPHSYIDLQEDEHLLQHIAAQLQDASQFTGAINRVGTYHQEESTNNLELKNGKVFEWSSRPQLLDNINVGQVWNFRDISERIRIQKIIEASEKKYKDLFEKSDDANLIILNGLFIDCNQATVKMLGYRNKKELLDTHPSQLSPETQPNGEPSYEKANKMMEIAYEKGSHRFEWIHQKANGELFPAEVLLTSIEISGEKKILHTVWRDISNRKLAEEELKREKILLRTVIDNVPHAIYTKDRECRKTLSNRMDLENLKCEKEEDAIGKTDFDFFQKEIAEAFHADDESVILQGQKIINREEFFFGKNGKKNWLLTSKLPLYDEKGNITGLVGIGHDITDRKRSELLHDAIYQISEAAQSALETHSLYKTIHSVVATLMPAENFFIALYDETMDLLSFPYMVDKYDPPYAPKKPGKGLTEYVMRKGEPFLISAEQDLDLRERGETELIGTPAEIWLGVPLKVEGKTIGVIVVQDYENAKAYDEDEMQILTFVAGQIAHVIERKRKEEEIKQYTEELRQLNQTKDKLFSIIAHDLRSPFHPILNIADILQSDIASLKQEEIAHFAHDIYVAAQGVYVLMGNILEWSRMQSGSIHFNPEKINLRSKIDEVIKHLAENATQKNISVGNLAEASIYVSADDQMLRSILHNLISNAIKFTNNEGVIMVKADAEPNAIKVSVTDNGVGISAARKKIMFSVDKDISTKGTNQEKGSGLGLLLCKEFVEKHGGKIWVESELQKGSTFSFTLPKGIVNEPEKTLSSSSL